MESTNLEKLAFNLNSTFILHPLAHNILNATYVNLYLDIFYDEIYLHKEPVLSASFIDELKPLIDLNHEYAEQHLADFEKVWDGWVMLYKDLQLKKVVSS